MFGVGSSESELAFRFKLESDASLVGSFVAFDVDVVVVVVLLDWSVGCSVAPFPVDVALVVVTTVLCCLLAW